jgi:hypothetical protein
VEFVSTEAIRDGPLRAGTTAVSVTHRFPNTFAQGRLAEPERRLRPAAAALVAAGSLVVLQIPGLLR